MIRSAVEKRLAFHHSHSLLSPTVLAFLSFSRTRFFSNRVLVPFGGARSLSVGWSRSRRCSLSLSEASFSAAFLGTFPPPYTRRS